MAQSHYKDHTQFTASSGILLCWVAVFIYAASNSIVTMLVAIGDENRVNGHNIVTFSNLLVLGSLISLVPMLVFFWRDWTPKNLRTLNASNWGVLIISSVLSSAVTPGLYFYALENTTVTNVVIAGRIDPPLFLLAAALFLNEKLDPWALVGGIIILLGAVFILFMKEDGGVFSVGTGEIAAVVATLSFTASTIITRASLRNVPLGVFSIFRTVLGTSIYLTFNLLFSSHNHFGDMFQPILMKWIWVYAVVVIIFGQLAWNLGLKYAKSRDVALATSFSPLAAIAIAVLLLGEDPGPGFKLGAAIIFFGICLSQFGRRKRTYKKNADIGKTMQLEGQVNFKGV